MAKATNAITTTATTAATSLPALMPEPETGTPTGVAFVPVAGAPMAVMKPSVSSGLNNAVFVAVITITALLRFVRYQVALPRRGGLKDAIVAEQSTAAP